MITGCNWLVHDISTIFQHKKSFQKILLYSMTLYIIYVPQGLYQGSQGGDANKNSNLYSG